MEKMDFTPLSVSAFQERTTAAVVRYYNSPDDCFKLVKESYFKNSLAWTEGEKILALMNYFRDCYKAYNADEKRKIYLRFLSLSDELDLSEKGFERLFSSFFLLIRKRSESSDFIVSAIRHDCYADIVNTEFVQEYDEEDSSLFRDVFVRRICEIVDHLYDSTISAIASRMTDRYTMYDNVLHALLEKGKDSLVIVFLNNGNLLISKECLNDIILYAKKKDSSRLLKAAYHTFLFKNSINFSSFYSYYNMLSEKEKEEDSMYLKRIIEVNHLEKPFFIMKRQQRDRDLLNGLTIDEFTTLSEIIQKDYGDVFFPYLVSAMKKRLKYQSGNDEDILFCLNHYQNYEKELLSMKELSDYSLTHSSFRKEYLILLMKNDCLSKCDIKKYQG